VVSRRPATRVWASCAAWVFIWQQLLRCGHGVTRVRHNLGLNTRISGPHLARPSSAPATASSMATARTQWAAARRRSTMVRATKLPHLDSELRRRNDHQSEQRNVPAICVRWRGGDRRLSRIEDRAKQLAELLGPVSAAFHRQSDAERRAVALDRHANQSSLLLDIRLKDGSSDNTLAIGRTSATRVSDCTSPPWQGTHLSRVNGRGGECRRFSDQPATHLHRQRQHNQRGARQTVSFSAAARIRTAIRSLMPGISTTAITASITARRRRISSPAPVNMLCNAR